MTSVPYPTFTSTSQVAASAASLPHFMASVGRCRINPTLSSAYQIILSKCKSQYELTCSGDKKGAKKCMKESVALAYDFLASSSSWNLDPSIIDIEVMLPSQDILDTDGNIAVCFLDGGVDKVVVSSSGDDLFLEVMKRCRIPRERMVAHFDDFESISNDSGELNLKVVIPYASTVSVALHEKRPVTEETALQVKAFVDKALLDADPMKAVRLVIQITPTNRGALTAEDDLAKMIGAVCKGFKGRGTVTLTDPTVEELGSCYVACIRTDREDGLFTTVVCTRSNEALGLVYSSKESIITSLTKGRGVYYSRSRNSLWEKGLTSGNYQILHRIDIDCDGDAIRFTVTQKGCGQQSPAFCHLNTLTCWGEPRSLRHLEQTLASRLNTAPEGSYTKRLFQDPELLRDKLVEEAQELAEADDQQHIAEELADLVYFAFVKAAKMGVGMDDLGRELDKRARKVTRRKGDSKKERIEAGDKILAKGREEK